jgi:hypothetical protein
MINLTACISEMEDIVVGNSQQILILPINVFFFTVVHLTQNIERVFIHLFYVYSRSKQLN